MFGRGLRFCYIVRKISGFSWERLIKDKNYFVFMVNLKEVDWPTVVMVILTILMFIWFVQGAWL